MQMTMVIIILILPNMPLPACLYHFGGQVDKLDNSVDFARAYGALGWALSKVIKRKDGLPRQLLHPVGYVSEDW